MCCDFSRNLRKTKLSCLGQQRNAVYTFLVLAGVGAVLGSCSSSLPPSGSPQAQLSPASPVGSSPSQNSSPISLPPAANSSFIVAAVQKVGPAVVRIDSTRTVTTQAPEVFDDPFFQRFFGQNAPPSKEIVRGVGSGFIISSNGQILTNAHVVNGVSTVNVTLKDGRTFKGQVLGEDPVTDVAVVKIESNNLPTVGMGNSSTLQPGDWAIAIGNPLGLDNTVTSGIISAINRSSADVGVSHDPVNFIQTDAAINPGNSGGPLLNANGQVIGINTAIINGAQGIGFAIPINTAQTIAQQLITKGKVEHTYLGVEMAMLTPELKQKINNASNGQIRVVADQGVVIVRVVTDSPAAQAGLQPGDVIQKINNQPVTKTVEVQRLVENTQVGSQLQVVVQRNGQPLQVTVKTAPLPPQPAQPEG
ncbi:MAG: trypsin-like peptidase domain-containing protein [Chroococcidiopsidaceae cyanobacterium CP_BM_RX_35]|nr:trypsin-like peptidase domain-containing protein [Chroococcidiopsidaceae cyanobacterium CP_BM_RX_35]